MGNVQRLQDGLKKLWTDELYSDQFKSSPSRYKHFDHTLKHLRKAAQELENMSEEADHHGAAMVFEGVGVRKYVADLVICSIRMANVIPTGEIDLEQAVFDRVERKMGVKLEREADGEERRLNEKVAVLKKALWEKVRVWNDPSDRNFMLCGICGSPEVDPHKPGCVLA